MADFDPTLFGGSVPDPDVPEIPSGTLRPTTYGPGSPNPTPADLKEKIGNANNPLKAGDVALQPDTAKQYGLKTGDRFQYEGHTYNYADTPAARVGHVIDVYHPAEGGGFDPSPFIGDGTSPQQSAPQQAGTRAIKTSFDTRLSSNEEQQFQQWKSKYAPNDSGQDYDLRGAFKAGLTPDLKTGHWPDTFKKPNHPTFSDQSVYAQYGNPGHWQGDTFIPGTPTEQQPAPQQASGSPINAGFNPAQFDAPETPSATPTPPSNKNSLVASVGAAIAQGGAALRQSQGAVQPANYQYRTPPPPPASEPVKPIPVQKWVDLATRAAFKVTVPTNLMAQDQFDAAYNSLPRKAKNALNTPLFNADQARGLIQQGAQFAGAGAPELLRFVENTKMGAGAMDTAANTISQATTGNAALSMPAFLIPGVAETWAAKQASQTPAAWGQVQQAVSQNGLFSREGFAALTQEMVRLGSIGLAAKGGAHLQDTLGTLVRESPKPPPVQPRTPPPLPPSAFENQVGVSAIANKYQPETAGLGKGSSPSEAIARGSQFTPEEINQHLSDLNAGTGDIQAQTAAVRVEGARLQARSEAAGKALQANPRSIELQKAADDAFKDWVDFQNGSQAKLKATWARMGHELQGSVPVDLSSVNGLRQKFFNEVGREATISETKVLGKYARAVEETQKAYLDKLNEGLDQITKRSKNVDASPETMAKIRENIANRMGKKFPCRN